MKIRSKILMVILPVVACFAFLPGAQAVCQDGCGSNFNTFQGENALFNVGDGVGNTAFGWESLAFTSATSFNTGIGGGALALNNSDDNTAVGAGAMLLNLSGADNTAVGTDALLNNDSGADNNAIGSFALFSNGDEAGANVVSGSGNVYIGAGMQGQASDENDSTFIRNVGTTIQVNDPTTPFFYVTVDPSTGQMGYDNVFVPVANPNGAVLELKSTVKEQQATIDELKSTVAQQQKGMEILTAQLKEQAAQIQKVSAQVQVSKTAPQVVVNKP